MRKFFSATALLLGLMGFQNAQAKDGYKIKINLKGAPDSLVYLAHYYGKALPTIYKTDSATFKNGVATIEGNEKILGGIYIIMLNDKATYFELLLNNGDDFEVSGTKTELPQSLTFKNSPENTRFLQYMHFLKGYGEKMQQMQSQLQNAKKTSDTTGLHAKINSEQNVLNAYRDDYKKKYPSSLLSKIFAALETPQIPPGPHKLADGSPDTLFTYKYYKQHFWDGFDFQDDRLIHTPIYDAKLDEYFNKLVYPYPDSVIYEANRLLEKTRGTKELFKYTLWWTQKFARGSNVMGMDEVFVYLIENYYMKGDAYWLSDKELTEYYDRAQKIKPNVIGNVAPPLIMKTYEDKAFSLNDVKSKYTMLVFWSPTCGHCLTETPRIDSAYKELRKKYDVSLIGVRTEGEKAEWKKIIDEKKFDQWTHIYDPNHESNFRATYDIIATPVLYLLDQNKKIVGKKLDHSNVGSLIETLEKRKSNL